ncbi:MAG: hypothetical protein KA972_02070 [Brachymonas sp.]|jgi:hypothetical protein|nr:hypothetical protein [Brachymonas sp.]
MMKKPFPRLLPALLLGAILSACKPAPSADTASTPAAIADDSVTVQLWVDKLKIASVNYIGIISMGKGQAISETDVQCLLSDDADNVYRDDVKARLLQAVGADGLAYADGFYKSSAGQKMIEPTIVTLRALRAGSDSSYQRGELPAPTMEEERLAQKFAASDVAQKISQAFLDAPIEIDRSGVLSPSDDRGTWQTQAQYDAQKKRCGIKP